MIHIKDLRVGNWVTLEGLDSPFQITPRSFGLFERLFETGTVITDYDPIPLSPEVLTALGFHKHNSAWVLDDYNESEHNKDFFTVWNLFEDLYTLNTTQFPVDLTSVHQLMNVYYFLTGKELIFNPNTINK